MSSVLAGGQELGWNPDSAVVCWRRFLGLMGDFSTIANPTAAADVFEYLDSLTRSSLILTPTRPSKPTRMEPPRLQV